MVNKVILVGSVGKDPEVQYVSDDVPVARFSLATNESYKNKSGERVTNTEWHNIVVWRGLAKVAEQYVQKGQQLYLEGKIANKTYEKDGQTKYYTEIACSELKMLGKKSNGDQGQGSQNPPHASQPETDFSNEMEDDLPF